MHLLLALRMAEIGESKSESEMEFAREAVRMAARVEAIREERKAETPSRPAEPELIATREIIERAFDALPGQDHYQVLGVTVAVTSAELKKAYFRLAKSYHPDRHFDTTMADLKNKLEALFDRIHKAYMILGDQMKRAEYDMSAKNKAQGPAPKEADEFVKKRAAGYQEEDAEKVARAADQFNNGMREFKAGNYWGAVEAFTWATRLDPLKAPYFYYHGICLANIPRRKHEAEESLQKAIKLDPAKVEYHIELSNLYLKSNFRTKAVDVLNNALKRNPNSPKLKDAIKAAGGAVTKPAAEEKKSGVFSKLFKKEK
jgi:curved DNA-binding protein CbpA